MEKIVIAGVEGSGKTVLMAAFAERYSRPDASGCFLAPEDMRTLAFSQRLVAALRQGAWPSATQVNSVEALHWTLSRDCNGSTGKIREIEFLDYGGEVYRAAFGMETDGPVPASAVASLRQNIGEASWLGILVNLRDMIDGSPMDRRYLETSWLPKGIIDFATSGGGGHQAMRQSRIIVILTQADAYAETIKALGGPRKTLEKYLPHVASAYGNVEVLAVSAVNRVQPDENGFPVPAPDFGSDGLEEVMHWLARRSIPEWWELAAKYDFQIDESVASTGHCWFCGKPTNDISLFRMKGPWFKKYSVPVPCCGPCRDAGDRAPRQKAEGIFWYMVSLVAIVAGGAGAFEHPALLIVAIIGVVGIVKSYEVISQARKFSARLRKHPVIEAMASKGFRVEKVPQ